MKIHPVGAEMFRAVGRTDGKLIVAPRSFAKQDKNQRRLFVQLCHDASPLTPSGSSRSKDESDMT